MSPKGVIAVVTVATTSVGDGKLFEPISNGDEASLLQMDYACVGGAGSVVGSDMVSDRYTSVYLMAVVALVLSANLVPT